MYGMPTASDFTSYGDYGGSSYFPPAPIASNPISAYGRGAGSSGGMMGAINGGTPIGGAKGFGGIGGLEGLNMGLQGLSMIGNFWNAFQAQKLAKQQFAFTKEITNTNLNNQIKSYNTTLDDRARSRGFVEGQSAEQTQQYIDQNKLTR